MLKYILARLRWGSLTPEQKEKLKTITLKEVLRIPYLAPKLYTNY